MIAQQNASTDHKTQTIFPQKTNHQHIRSKTDERTQGTGHLKSSPTTFAAGAHIVESVHSETHITAQPKKLVPYCNEVQMLPSRKLALLAKALELEQQTCNSVTHHEDQMELRERSEARASSDQKW